VPRSFAGDASFPGGGTIKKAPNLLGAENYIEEVPLLKWYNFRLGHPSVDSRRFFGELVSTF
jgi:hypothetical protein